MRNQIKELRAILATVAMIHFCNAGNIRVNYPEIYEKTFLRLDNQELIDALSDLVDQYSIEKVTKILRSINFEKAMKER